MALDFLVISTRKRKGVTELYPTFKIDKANDLMTRGGDFYAIWDQNKNLWSTDEYDAIRLVDEELDAAAGELNYPDLFVSYMWNSDTGSIDRWHKYVQKQRPERFHELDTHVIFANEKITKRDYATKCLPYAIEEGRPEHFHQMFDILYAPEELHKLQWAIGAIMLGEAWKYQKFMVLVGPGGTGKSTFLNLVEQLLEGYTAPFIAKDLVGGGAFPLEAFANNPLVAIQHDGDLSRIEDNSVLNSLVSGEEMMVNEKYKKMYKMRFHTFLMLGTNKPVKITDAKSGLIRRLIDVQPTGNTLTRSEYMMHVKGMAFELGKIAWECINVYKEDPDYYVGYVPTSMLSATNDFYNFITDNYFELKEKGGISLLDAWNLYKDYCKDANVLYPFSRRVFCTELQNYYEVFHDRYTFEDGTRVRSYFEGFKADIFQSNNGKKKRKDPPKLILDRSVSELDRYCEDCPAQYSTEEGVPGYSWSKVKTKLKELDTRKEHWLKVPKNMVVIDFDIQKDGEKDREANLIAAAEWPETYAEFSKSGKGVHLHYIYNGDISKLAREYAEHIEIKTFPGNASLRRRLTLCNGAKIAEISGGLPLKEEDETSVVKEEKIRSVQALRRLIERNLRKEIHPGTKPSVEFIKKILDDCYESDLQYDVSDMINELMRFASSSTHHAAYCIKLVGQMKLKSSVEKEENEEADKAEPLTFFDVETFINLFVMCWKFRGKGQPVHKMINPHPDEVERAFRHLAIGFNNRRYDNHICYARIMGYKLEQLYELSQKIILKNDGFFSEAFNLSFTDIYDFCSKKQSLKKWEIELGIHHQELGIPWDKPVDPAMWDLVAEYCANDVLATEAVFEARQSDFVARQILADLADMTVNDTTNSLTTRIIFGKERHPQHVYTNLATGEQFTSKTNYTIDAGSKMPDVVVRDGIVQNFPGYEYAEEIVKKPDGTNTLVRHNYYRGIDLGLGGYVYAEPGYYEHVAVIDVQSLHPSSLIAMNCFGDYTQNFKDLVRARIYIKHAEYDKAGELFGGRLKPYLTDEKSAKALSDALKIAINSVYGLTSASFQNPMKDDRNVNNIVALRGALFMKTLQDEVVRQGFKAVHIKTDSIKIPNATKEIIDFCIDFAAKYGYSFEHESTYQKMCLVNGSTYVCRYDSAEWCQEHYGYLPSKQKPGEWSATALQFQVPYVFKTLFSKEKIEFDDLCEVKSVTGDSALYLDMDENLPDDQHQYKFVGRVGQFTPIKPGHGGGMLYRYKGDKYYAATGTKGYRWLESEDFREGKFTYEDIDISYYEEQVKEAKTTIGCYCDADTFCSDDGMDIGFMNPPTNPEPAKEFRE